MEAFEKWKAGHDQKLTNALNKSERGFELGLSLGWQAAMEQVQTWYKEYGELGDWDMAACLIQKNIREELAEE